MYEYKISYGGTSVSITYKNHKNSSSLQFFSTPPRCIMQRWVKLQIQIRPQIWNQKLKNVSLWIRSLGGFDSWKSRAKKFRATLPLNLSIILSTFRWATFWVHCACGMHVTMGVCALGCTCRAFCARYAYMLCSFVQHACTSLVCTESAHTVYKYVYGSRA